MRTKLTLLICACAVLGAAALAHAGPVTIAKFNFSTKSQVDSFTRTTRGKIHCAKKLRKTKKFGINAGSKTHRCEFRSSVVADAGDDSPSQEVITSATYSSKTPKKLRNRLYVGVRARASKSSYYELRVIPAIGKWQLVRRGTTGKPKIIKGGSGGFIRRGPGKSNKIALRAFSTKTGNNVSLRVVINGKTLYNKVDTASGHPAGRWNELVMGNKKGGSVSGALVSFDDYVIRVPNPF